MAQFIFEPTYKNMCDIYSKKLSCDSELNLKNNNEYLNLNL